jgi:hypothetical protein
MKGTRKTMKRKMRRKRQRKRKNCCSAFVPECTECTSSPV